MTKRNEKVEQGVEEIAGLFKSKFKLAYKETLESFTAEDKREFEDLSRHFARAVVKGDDYLMDSYNTALGLFLAVECREKGKIVRQKLNELIVDALPIIRTILLGIVGVSL